MLITVSRARRSVGLWAAVVAAALAVVLGCLQPGPPEAWATSDYSQTLHGPCIACHISATSPDLNTRGQAFAAIDTHRSDPASAWAQVLQSYPMESAQTLPGWLPLAAIPLAIVAGALIARRRRLSARSL